MDCLSWIQLMSSMLLRHVLFQFQAFACICHLFTPLMWLNQCVKHLSHDGGVNSVTSFDFDSVSVCVCWQ